jgi:hypothetical protein
MQSNNHTQPRSRELRKYFRHFDYCRYFPEWAERPARTGPEVEADRNSYLANGYAEEFGHRALEQSTDSGVPGDGPPEEWEQWRGQSGATHPGYPERGTPVEQIPTVDRSRLAASDNLAARYAQAQAPARGGVIVVSTRVGDRKFAARRAAARLVERGFAALLLLRALRRELQRRAGTGWESSRLHQRAPDRQRRT